LKDSSWPQVTRGFPAQSIGRALPWFVEVGDELLNPGPQCLRGSDEAACCERLLNHPASSIPNWILTGGLMQAASGRALSDANIRPSPTGCARGHQVSSRAKFPISSALPTAKMDEPQARRGIDARRSHRSGRWQGSDVPPFWPAQLEPERCSGWTHRAGARNHIRTPRRWHCMVHVR
jgi:hypothetical protein